MKEAARYMRQRVLFGVAALRHSGAPRRAPREALCEAGECWQAARLP